MNNAVSLSHLVLGLRPDKDGGKFSVTEACICVERVAGTEPVSLAGVCTVVWKGWLVQSLYLLQECAQLCGKGGWYRACISCRSVHRGWRATSSCPWCTSWQPEWVPRSRTTSCSCQRWTQWVDLWPVSLAFCLWTLPALATRILMSCHGTFAVCGGTK